MRKIRMASKRYMYTHNHAAGVILRCQDNHSYTMQTKSFFGVFATSNTKKMYDEGAKCIIVLYCFLLSSTSHGVLSSDNDNQILEWTEPKSCAKYEYFDTNLLKCIRCASNLVSSADGFGCVCDENSKTIDIKKGNPICERCEAGKIVTIDGHECISCGKFGTCGCLENEIRIERNWNGSLLGALQCLPCPKNAYPSADGTRCFPCGYSISEDDANCAYSTTSYEKLQKYCGSSKVPSNWPDVRNTYLNKFKTLNIDSFYFRVELRFTMDLCEKEDRKACRHLANICALTLFADSSIACKFFLPNSANNPIKLFYRQGETRTILNQRTITQRYTLDKTNPNSKLKLVVAAFSLRGDLETIGEPRLSCPFFSNVRFGVNLYKSCKISAIELLNEKMTFLVPYLSYYESNSSKRLLHALPVLVRNSEDYTDTNYVTQSQLVRMFFLIDRITGYKAIPNTLKNVSFTKAPELEVLRYIKSLQLVVKLQERKERGKIFPPLLIVEYDELTNEEIIKNVEVSIEYKVTYSFDTDEINSAIEICMGVFAAVSVAFAAIKAWSTSRRNNENFLSMATFMWFVVYSFGSVGSTFFIVSSVASIYTLIFYKGQKVVHILLPSDANESTIRICTILAFAFKIVEILGLIYHHRKVNIFFIDWEQPRSIGGRVLKYDSPRTSLKKSYTGRFSMDMECNVEQSVSESIAARRNKNSSSRSSQASSTPSRQSTSGILNPISNVTAASNNEYTTANICFESIFSIDDHNISPNSCSVSIWRTCVVANEWLKMKTKRKVNVLLQMLATIFIFEIIGVKYWSMPVPEWSLQQEKVLTIQESFTLQYAVGALVYTILYFVQWWLTVFIYEKYVKNQLQEFIDLCSMTNISVFILSHDYYGYYIHGRSVHGFADTDLLTLINDLKREENNLCAHRGLIPGTTEQTFVISVSKAFRTFYDALLGSQNFSNETFLRRNASKIPNWDERWKTHLKLRKFLTAFLDHCYKNVDYTVKERHWMEKLCDVDLSDVNEKSIFYIDNNYSFNQTIFYGNEWTLATFEISVFLFVLVLGGNYIVAAVVTALTAKTVNYIARVNEKRILASKTLIDERFLLS